FPAADSAGSSTGLHRDSVFVRQNRNELPVLPRGSAPVPAIRFSFLLQGISDGTIDVPYCMTGFRHLCDCSIISREIKLARTHAARVFWPAIPYPMPDGPLSGESSRAACGCASHVEWAWPNLRVVLEDRHS